MGDVLPPPPPLDASQEAPPRNQALFWRYNPVAAAARSLGISTKHKARTCGLSNRCWIIIIVLLSLIPFFVLPAEFAKEPWDKTKWHFRYITYYQTKTADALKEIDNSIVLDPASFQQISQQLASAHIDFTPLIPEELFGILVLAYQVQQHNDIALFLPEETFDTLQAQASTLRYPEWYDSSNTNRALIAAAASLYTGTYEAGIAGDFLHESRNMAAWAKSIMTTSSAPRPPTNQELKETFLFSSAVLGILIVPLTALFFAGCIGCCGYCRPGAADRRAGTPGERQSLLTGTGGDSVNLDPEDEDDEEEGGGGISSMVGTPVPNTYRHYPFWCCFIPSTMLIVFTLVLVYLSKPDPMKKLHTFLSDEEEDIDIKEKDPDGHWFAVYLLMGAWLPAALVLINYLFWDWLCYLLLPKSRYLQKRSFWHDCKHFRDSDWLSAIGFTVVILLLTLSMLEWSTPYKKVWRTWDYLIHPPEHLWYRPFLHDALYDTDMWFENVIQTTFLYGNDPTKDPDAVDDPFADFIYMKDRIGIDEGSEILGQFAYGMVWYIYAWVFPLILAAMLSFLMLMPVFWLLGRFYIPPKVSGVNDPASVRDVTVPDFTT